MLPGLDTSYCPSCGNRLEFQTDGFGRSIEVCDCGHRQLVKVRGTPKHDQSERMMKAIEKNVESAKRRPDPNKKKPNKTRRVDLTI